MDCEKGGVSIVGVSAGELVVTAVLTPSSEFPSSELAIAVTLTKYWVPSAIPGKLLELIVREVPKTLTITTLGLPVPGES
jgi:hypothetical protein